MRNLDILQLFLDVVTLFYIASPGLDPSIVGVVPTIN